MKQTPKYRSEILQNLSVHAASARSGMGLSLPAAARLLKTDQGTIEDIEWGKDVPLSIESIINLARGLGLTDLGTPRGKPAGSF
ncbi:helix-turn-helix domain-containing protein [Methylobacterium sp. WL12]|uniref:helix-turn-helix domain-containing protein n=1 Tax=Methylobacterium sp. WL12 TaxID=2603890 RepID=UPI0011C956B6|nr:helix-turn-helix transcriptional regulator [Methylobacterium sp. WL12]TXM64859.1 helix-turn-helix domain-containing protein [Methylobacterium sp. WL12]